MTAWDDDDFLRQDVAFCSQAGQTETLKWAGGCRSDSGCMLAFRYDHVMRIRALEGNHHMDQSREVYIRNFKVSEQARLVAGASIPDADSAPLGNPSEYLKIVLGFDQPEKLVYIGDLAYWEGNDMHKIIRELLEEHGFLLDGTGEINVMSEAFEHIGGPGGCEMPDKLRLGYSGYRISFEEAEMNSIGQCLVPRDMPLKDQRNSRLDDEDWEKDPNTRWALSGLCMGILWNTLLSPFPKRQSEDPCVVQGYSGDGHYLGHSVPFHPTCFEVLKRVALHRHGTFDVEKLGRWFSATYDFMWRKFPKHAAVERGWQDLPMGCWSHCAGDEWLVANPCHIPGLEQMLHTASQRARQVRPPVIPADADTVTFGQESKRNHHYARFMDLPGELHDQILDRLDEKSVVNIALVWPILRARIGDHLLGRLSLERPYLWELWSQSPCSKWTTISPSELWRSIRNETRQDARADDHAAQAPLTDGARTNGHSGLQTLLQNIPKDNIVDFLTLLYEAIESGDLKGLRNRQRIWQIGAQIWSQIEILDQHPDLVGDVYNIRNDRYWINNCSQPLEKLLYG